MEASVQKIMRILRESNDYSQEYVANVLNINQKTYSNLESGKTKITLERLSKLAKLYGISVEVFLKDELPMIDFNLVKLISFPNHQTNFMESAIRDPFLEKIIKEQNEKINLLERELHQLKTDNLNILRLFKQLDLKY